MWPSVDRSVKKRTVSLGAVRRASGFYSVLQVNYSRAEFGPNNHVTNPRLIMPFGDTKEDFHVRALCNTVTIGNCDADINRYLLRQKYGGTKKRKKWWGVGRDEEDEEEREVADEKAEKGKTYRVLRCLFPKLVCDRILAFLVLFCEDMVPYHFLVVPQPVELVELRHEEKENEEKENEERKHEERERQEEVVIPLLQLDFGLIPAVGINVVFEAWCGADCRLVVDFVSVVYPPLLFPQQRFSRLVWSFELYDNSAWFGENDTEIRIDFSNMRNESDASFFVVKLASRSAVALSRLHSVVVLGNEAAEKEDYSNDLDLVVDGNDKFYTIPWSNDKKGVVIRGSKEKGSEVYAVSYFVVQKKLGLQGDLVGFV